MCKNEESIQDEQVFFSLQREGRKPEMNQGNLPKIYRTTENHLNIIYKKYFKKLENKRFDQIN